MMGLRMLRMRRSSVATVSARLASSQQPKSSPIFLVLLVGIGATLSCEGGVV